MEAKLETKSERVREYYSPAELLELGDQVAESVGAMETVNDELKKIKKNLTAEVDTHAAVVKDLTQKIRQGYHYDHVNCCICRDFHEKEVHTIRMDTGELISTRPMQPHETQRPLDLVEASNAYGVKSIDEVKKIFSSLNDGGSDEIKIASSFFSGKWKEAKAFVKWIKKVKGLSVVSPDDETITLLTLSKPAVEE